MNATAERSRLVDEGLATVSEAGRFLGISRAKLYQMMDRGQLTYCKLGRNRRVPWRAVKTLAAESLVARDAV
jgi:excisionase family DNA binding protein